ncbi:hypothetical protein EBR77_04470 [bacterium]|nr:hypothetical protein [bacterium]
MKLKSLLLLSVFCTPIIQADLSNVWQNWNDRTKPTSLAELEACTSCIQTIRAHKNNVESILESFANAKVEEIKSAQTAEELAALYKSIEAELSNLKETLTSEFTNQVKPICENEKEDANNDKKIQFWSHLSIIENAFNIYHATAIARILNAVKEATIRLHIHIAFREK